MSGKVDELRNIFVVKKDGRKERWSRRKLMTAINKAAIRTRSYVYNDGTVLQRREIQMLYSLIEGKVKLSLDGSNKNEISTEILHSFIIESLETVCPDVGRVYKDYHNYRVAEAREYESVMKSIESLTVSGNLDNANSDSLLVATQNNLAACFIEKSRFENYFLTNEEKEILKDGFFYIHDEDHRMLYGFNCCLFNIENLLNKGYTINGVDYTKPHYVRSMLSEMKDTILSATASQYGGFTIPRIERIIAKYAKIDFERRFPKKLEKELARVKKTGVELTDEAKKIIEEDVREEIIEDILEDIKQGYQGLEYGLNTVASSRGDFPFTTISLGNSILGDFWAEKVCEIILQVRREGQGVKGKKRPVIFPKICFLYDESLHGKGMPYEHIFNEAVKCSCETMYPDYISLTGYGYVSDIYTRYNGIERVFSKNGKEVVEVKIADGYLDGRCVPLDDPRRKEAKYSHGHPEVAITSMGCRSFLSPYYSHFNVKQGLTVEELKANPDKYEILPVSKRGFIRYIDKSNGYTYTTSDKDYFYPLKEEEIPIYEGRLNNGVITLNLPLIYQYCKVNNVDFYAKLDYYLKLIRNFHLRSIQFNSKKKCSTNPYGFVYGGLVNSNGNPAYKKHSDTIKSVLSSGTASFGVTALNELQLVYNGKTIRQVMEKKFKQEKEFGVGAPEVEIPFCEQVIDYINNRIEEFKEEDGVLYSLYATPAEKLSGTQMTQFKKMFPFVRIKGFTNNTWVSNSFHLHVSENVTPSQKQDYEFDLFHKFNGGHIQYVRLNSKFNKAGVASIIRRGMRYGFYQGVNIDLNYCNNCGERFDSDNMKINECPRCGSRKITSIERICGYLGFTRRGDFIEEGNETQTGNRINTAMVDNIKSRVCM